MGPQALPFHLESPHFFQLAQISGGRCLERSCEGHVLPSRQTTFKTVRSLLKQREDGIVLTRVECPPNRLKELFLAMTQRVFTPATSKADKRQVPKNSAHR